VLTGILEAEIASLFVTWSEASSLQKKKAEVLQTEANKQKPAEAGLRGGKCLGS
jgi:hypothetical protein